MLWLYDWYNHNEKCNKKLYNLSSNEILFFLFMECEITLKDRLIGIPCYTLHTHHTYSYDNIQAILERKMGEVKVKRMSWVSAQKRNEMRFHFHQQEREWKEK